MKERDNFYQLIFLWFAIDLQYKLVCNTMVINIKYIFRDVDINEKESSLLDKCNKFYGGFNAIHD